VETSLLDLIHKENDRVSAYNIALASYDTARKNGMSTLKQKNELKRARLEVDKSRNELRHFLRDTLGIQISNDIKVTM
jgi:hypothetical protein